MRAATSSRRSRWPLFEPPHLVRLLPNARDFDDLGTSAPRNLPRTPGLRDLGTSFQTVLR